MVASQKNHSKIHKDQNKAFDFASGVTKLLVSLATGVITITITFGSNTLTGQNDIVWPLGLLWSWILLVLSIFTGICAMMAMTGVLSKEEKPNVYSCSIRFWEVLQMITFIIGIVFSIAFTYKNITVGLDDKSDKEYDYDGLIIKAYQDKCNKLIADTFSIKIRKNY